MTRILVIEDADPLRNDIVEMLTFEGFDVDSAENGIMGLERAREFRPDLIICDIMMPELDGYGVLNELRKDTEMVTTPFIFLTAKTDRTDVRQGMGLGADDYLTKPFVAAELLESIEARLEKRKTFNDMANERVKSLSANIITALPHELRTPLNTIIGFSDMLITESHRISKDQIADWGRHINLAGQRLYRLVENYLMYVRTEIIAQNEEELAALKSRRLHHPSTTVQVRALIRAQTVNREEDLVAHLVDEVPVRISDQDLGKIVEEVVDNALKFSQPGTPVIVETQVAGDRFVVRTTNEGRGMTQEQIDTVGAYMQFNRWFYEQQGSGLGLAIVKQLVQLYDGELAVETPQEGKITVVVRLPLG